ncbi:NAD(P)H-quinone oxidoreductase [Coralloluteibacterium thermophilus]|uniref:NAD(P)H-quinone oxidoreductase n=1 Tax=Coralloluteibacterium thermophilum TaxID=2707049 RepID=A0ABV9NP80_9GAMM
MRYIDHGDGGEAGVLTLAEMPAPQPATGQVLVRVAHAGVNRPDVQQRKGVYPPPADASPVLGLEVAGHIEALGEGVDGWRVGDPVCALTPGGGYAEYCVTPAAHCLPVPRGLSLAEAAALPETCFTVWSNVFDRGRLQAGETLLVHGGSSGIGTTAIQMARALGAASIVTVGGADKARACLALGARAAIDYREQDFVEEVKRLTDGRGVDVILDMVGGDYTPRNLRCLAVGGRLVQIAFLRGRSAELDLGLLMTRRLHVTGSTLRPQSHEAKAAIARSLRERVWPEIEAGAIRPIVHARFPLERAAEAHRLMESSGHIGKIVLDVRGGDA